MRIESLELRSFRNYAHAQTDFHPERNILIGDNAQGKTNLLEAILCLSRGASPRTRRESELIRFGDTSAVLTARIYAHEREILMEQFHHAGQRRQTFVNHVPISARNAPEQAFHTVLFTPEDLFLVRGGPAVRRKFLDTALCQLRPRYAVHLAAFRRALAQKTTLLKDAETTDHAAGLAKDFTAAGLAKDFTAAGLARNFTAAGLPQYPVTEMKHFPVSGLPGPLPEFNEQLAVHGAQIIRYRARFLRRLEESAAAYHANCSGGQERLTLRYETVSVIDNPETDVEEIAERLRARLRELERAEAAAHMCLSGPHRDDFLVFLNNLDARTYASQGQARTAALALKLAERELLQRADGETPVLLLDDVLSELDPKRQEFVLNRAAGGQIFLTCCEDERLAGVADGKILHVRGGMFV